MILQYMSALPDRSHCISTAAAAPVRGGRADGVCRLLVPLGK